MSRLLQHLRVGLRSLRRAPGFAATAILTLALGIGLATAVFTVADALLLRRLPVADQDRLVVLSGATPDGRMTQWPFGLESGDELARRTGPGTPLARVAFYHYEGASPKPVRLGDEAGEVSRLRRALVSGDWFAVLGARPLLGRALRPEDDAAGAPPVAVLSHRAWQERFGGAPDVLGRRIALLDEGHTYTVVGVMPPGLDWPRGTEFWGTTRAAVPPANLQYVARLAVGRLAPDATLERAREHLTAYYQRESAPPPLRTLRGVAEPLPRLLLGDARPAVLVFAAAAAFLLVITCVNVANLLLVRGLARTREVALRAALGARRQQVVGQLLAEHAVLAAAGGVAGVAVAALAVRAFVAVAPAGLPRVDEVALNLPALAASVAITGAAMLLFAVAPAVLTARVAPAEVLRAGGRHSAGQGARLAAAGLVAAQVALAFVLLAGAGLLGRSFLRLQRADLAFDGSRLLVAELALPLDRYAGPQAQRPLVERLAREAAALPGVQAVTPVVAAPFSGTGGWDGRPRREGQSEAESAANPMLNMELVTPAYFATFALPALAGRTLTADDREGGTPVVVLSAAAARAHWPDGKALGGRLLLAPGMPPVTVVGVVPDTRWRDLREARPTIYFPLAQSAFPFVPTTLALRTAGAPEGVVPALRALLAEQAPGVALASAQPFARFLDAPLAQPRLNALLLAAFAAAAVTLAAVGLFGVMATLVRQRTRELGVRLALGATAGDVVRLVLRRGLAIGAVGTALGLAGALLLNRLGAGLLHEVSPTDAWTLLTVAAALLGVSALASALPARSGARVDPATALRAEG